MQQGMKFPPPHPSHPSHQQSEDEDGDEDYHEPWNGFRAELPSAIRGTNQGLTAA